MGTTFSNDDENTSNTLHPVEPITQKDIDLIKLSWDKIENKELMGTGIMIRIFQAHKEIKGKWIFATNLETEAEMVSNPQVRYHAKKITDVFTKAVTILCSSSPNAISLDELNLVRLGRSHFHYGVTRDNFVHFEESLIYSLKQYETDKKEINVKVERAWRKFFWLVANTICQGIDLERAERESKNGKTDAKNNAANTNGTNKNKLESGISANSFNSSHSNSNSFNSLKNIN